MNHPDNDSVILFEVADGVATITLNRPKAYNALNLALAEGLLDALIRCDEDAAVRAVLVTGQGAAFCAGGDIKPMLEEAQAYGGTAQYLKTLTVRVHAVASTIARMPKLVITAVNGVAAGAGFSLAITGDLVVAADNARFTLAYTAVGLAPDGASTFFLPRLIGPKRALELMCSNRSLSAAEAYNFGLVNEVFPAAEFAAKARRYAATLASGPTVAFGCAKKLVTLSAESSIETQMEHERRAIAACGRTEDFREGANAFFAKRRANFRGR
jgi:2-(1,2-epoxy-1,2-dihydrophenyl)acetyl-CoA isomerase